MEEISLFDKFGILFNNILENPLFIVFFFIPIILFFLKKRHGKKVYIIVYFISILVILLLFGDVLFKLFDNLMDGIFMTLYFPNFITLFIVVLLCAIMGLVSLLSTHMHKINKIINYIGFLVIYSLFALVLVTIRTNEINIYKDNALYSNSDVLALMQILIGAFAVQVVSLLVIYLINKATSILDRKESMNSIDEQIESLKKGKIKAVNIDNEKIGYINVADKKVSSKPLFKPFKFNIDKLESIKLDVITPPKILTPISIDNKDVTYLNEVAKPKKINVFDIDTSKDVSVDSVESLFDTKYKRVNLDSSKDAFLNVNNDSIKPLNLNISNISYFNETLSPKKFKFSKIDSSKIVSLNSNRAYKYNNLNVNSVSYLNEVKEKIKPLYIDFDKIVTINSGFKERLFKRVFLKDKDISYLKEVIKPKKFKLIDLNFNSIKSIEFSHIPNKLYNIISIDSNKSVYEKPEEIETLKLNTPINQTNDDKSEFDRIFNMKPDLMKPMEEDVNLIDNLVIIDIQSTLDTIVKYRLVKDAKISGYSDNLAVDNLTICNLGLLMSLINKYKLMK